MARTVIVCCFVLAASLLAGCGGGKGPVEGDWEASLVEKNGPPVQVGIHIEADRATGALSGTFTVLSDLPRGADIKKGQPFPLRDIKLEGSKLTFVVELVKDDEEENLHFDLELKGGELVGTAAEGRHVGQKRPVLPVTLRRTR